MVMLESKIIGLSKLQLLVIRKITASSDEQDAADMYDGLIWVGTCIWVVLLGMSECDGGQRP